MEKTLGQYGEELAAAYLSERGYRIETMNYYTQFGELDIIATDGDVLCFIEVKTRNDASMGSPLEAVTVRKQKQIAWLAACYLNEKKIEGIHARFDVVGVTIHPEDGNGAPKIELIQDAFGV